MADEFDYASIIADPNLMDPEYDISNIRTTTPTSERLLSAVPEYSGLKFDPTQQSVYSDLYSLYGGGLDSYLADVDPPTENIPNINQPGEGQTGIFTTPAAQNMGGGVNNVIPTTTAPFVETSPNVLAATNVPETPIVPTRDGVQVIVDPRTGDTYAPGDYSDVAGTLADPREKIDNYQDPNFLEKARDNFINTGQDIGNTFKDLVSQGIDISKMAGTTILNLVGKAATGIPLLGTAISMLPEDTSEDTFNRQFAIDGQAFQDIATSDPGLGARLQGYSSDLNQGQNIPGKDPFGRNTVSAFGDYEKTLAEDLQYTGDNQFNLDKKSYAQAYFDKKGIADNPNEAKTFEEKYGISPTGSPVTRDILIDEGIEAADEEPGSNLDLTFIAAAEEAQRIENERAANARENARAEAAREAAAQAEAEARAVAREKARQPAPTYTPPSPHYDRPSGDNQNTGGGSPRNVGNPFGYNAGGLIRKKYGKR